MLTFFTFATLEALDLGFSFFIEGLFALIFQQKEKDFLHQYTNVNIFCKNPDSIGAIFCNGHIDPMQYRCSSTADYIFFEVPQVLLS